MAGHPSNELRSSVSIETEQVFLRAEFVALGRSWKLKDIAVNQSRY